KPKRELRMLVWKRPLSYARLLPVLGGYWMLLLPALSLKLRVESEIASNSTKPYTLRSKLDETTPPAFAGAAGSAGALIAGLATGAGAGAGIGAGVGAGAGAAGAAPGAAAGASCASAAWLAKSNEDAKTIEVLAMGMAPS